MEIIENKINLLKTNLLDMTHIVKIQLQKCKQAVFNLDIDLAVEVMGINKRIEMLNFQISQYCEDIFANFQLENEDLRLIVAIVEINICLREIGNRSHNICKRLTKMENQYNKELLNEFKLNKMFDKAIKMLYVINEALEKNDTFIAGKTIKKDHSINKIKRKSNVRASQWLEKLPEDFLAVFYILATVSDIEVIADYVKNISSGIVFYMEVGQDRKDFLLSKVG